MFINEISTKVGLSKKAIRLYESKGLLEIKRNSNGYRVYSENDAIVLSRIKLLRIAGVAISDIKLFFDNVITIEELYKKRKSEIEKEAGRNSTQIDTFLNYMSMYENEKFPNDINLNESDTIDEVDSEDDLVVGVDIGTTNISAAVVNITKKSFVEFYTISNDSNITNKSTEFIEQNPEFIINKTVDLLAHIVENYKNIKSLGITGQMHGIVYINRDGKPISNMITWQDKRADLKINDNITYCDEIKMKTGYKISTGYGFATHYYNLKNGLVPENAYTFCNIADLVVMRLTERKFPLIHSSIAASFGLFITKKCNFDINAVKNLGMEGIKLPDVTNKFEICGTYSGIPVAVAFGDNQASFIGAVADLKNSILVNIGTGSQISVMSDKCEFNDDNVEVRPLFENKYLICGSALCGGAAYALLEKFFRAYNLFVNHSEEPQYDYMNKLAYNAYKEGLKGIIVDTTFRGKRNNTNIKGKIINITEENFTPGQLVLGFIYGICKELYDCFADIAISQKNVIASGNAVQRNPIFKEVLGELFNVDIKISHNKEEAATGVALFSAVGAKLLESEEEFGGFIRYENEQN